MNWSYFNQFVYCYASLTLDMLYTKIGLFVAKCISWFTTIPILCLKNSSIFFAICLLFSDTSECSK